MSNHSIPNALAYPMQFPSSAHLNAAYKNPSSSQQPRSPVISPAPRSSGSPQVNSSPRPLIAAASSASRPLVSFSGGSTPIRPLTTQPPPRVLAPTVHRVDSRSSIPSSPLNPVRPSVLPIQPAPPVLVPKRKRSVSEEDEEEDAYDEDDDESEDDDDEEDDSIVVSDDDEIEVEDDIPADENDPESARKIAAVLKEEADKFINKPLSVSCVGGRTLRNRATIKKPDQSHIELIREAYELDEKKELIKELGIWKNTLSKEAANAQVVWPALKPSMSIDLVRREHDVVRKKLGLESSDDEESEEEEDEDEDQSASIEEEEDEMSSSSSSEEEDEEGKE